MKKFMCIILSSFILFALNVSPTAATNDTWSENAEISSADVKIALIGDTHITRDVSAFENALEVQKTIAGGNVDGLALTGDVIYHDSTTELFLDRYDGLMSVLNMQGFGNDSNALPFVYAMGNHEFPQNGKLSDETTKASISLFEEKTGKTANHNVLISGYHFIAVAPSNYNGILTTETEQWAMEQIDAAIAEDNQKPVFLLIHRPVDHTIFDQNTQTCSADFEAYLKATPQIINLTAHMHIAAQLPQNIYQDGFTVFQTPHTAGGALWEWECESTSYLNTISQGSMIAITDNVVKIYKFDYNTREYIGTPWIIDIPQIISYQNDNNPDNDNDGYLYSVDKRSAGDIPRFPADAEISAFPYGDGISVTYPNTATVAETPNQQDGFIRAYRVDILNEGENVLSSTLWQCDFYYPAEKRAAASTRILDGFTPGGTYTVKVYPMSPLGTFGEPLTTTCTLPLEIVPDDVIRYEFDAYYPIDEAIKSCVLSSGGKLISSNQGGSMLDDNFNVPRDTDASYSFEITIPETGIYTIEYAMGERLNDYLSAVTLSIDDNVIGINDANYVKDISENKTYPWVYNPMRLYQKQNVSLTEGTHTVNVKVEVPVIDGRPNLFCADYIQFIPKRKTIQLDKNTRLEFEDFAEEFSETPKIVNSTGGTNADRYIHFDTGNRSDPISFSIPINVKIAGLYQFEYVASYVNSNTEFYLENESTPFFTADGTNFEVLETEKVNNLWPYFNDQWHQGKKHTFTAYLPEGSHEICGNLLTRSSGDGRDVAICMDYLDVTKLEEVHKKDNSVNAFISFKEPLTGDVLLAVYHDTTLVGVTTTTLQSQSYAYLSLPVATSVTKAKVFMWDNFTSLRPIQNVKIFPLNE